MVALEVAITPPVRQQLALLRLVPGRLDLQVRKQFRELAATVRSEARANAAAARPQRRSLRSTPSRGTGSWRDLVNSIRSGSSDRGPTVSVGSEKAPWVLGFEFGSLRGPRKRQFPAWSGNGDAAGYFFYPAVRAGQERILAGMDAALDEAARQAFPE